MSTDYDITSKKIAEGRKITRQEMNDLVMKVQTNKVAFSKYMSGFDLSPKQTLVIECMSKYPHTMFNSARQCGKSTTVALWNAHELYFGRPKDNTEHWIISYGPTQRKASRIYDVLYNKIIKRNPILFDYIESHSSKGYILLENGNKYESRTASPNTEVEGDSPTVIQIDESQGITDKQYYEGILPSGSTTSALIHEIFTPGGRNHVYNTWLSEDQSIAKITQPWYECPFADKAYILKMKTTSPPKKFAQEYLCEWNLDAGYAWNYHHIRASALLPPENEIPIRNKLYYSGIDVGKSPDKTVHWICERTPRGLRTVYISTIKEIDYTIITKQVAKELIQFKPQRALFDANAVGASMFDFLKETILDMDPSMRGWVRSRLKGVKIMNHQKHDMVGEVDLLLSKNQHTYEDFLRAKETNDIDKINFILDNAALLIHNDEDIVTEMISFTQNTSKAGNHIYFAEEGQHDDYPTGLMFCVHGYYQDSGALQERKRFASGKRADMATDFGARTFSFKPMPRTF